MPGFNLITARSIQADLPVRDADAHKHSAGRVWVISGAASMMGASIMAGLAAYRSGAGWVTLAIPEGLAPNIQYPELLVHAIPQHNGRITDAGIRGLLDPLRSAHSIVIGPGLTSREQSLAMAVIQLAIEHEIPLLIDAGALQKDWLEPLRGAKSEHVVLTPHSGEAKRLLQRIRQETDDREAAVSALKAYWGQVWVLKGAGTLVLSSKAALKNQSGGPMLATAGTGDILSGMIAGFLAQGLSASDAARMAVYIHGHAAERATSTQDGISLMATDLLAEIGPSIREIRGLA